MTDLEIFEEAARLARNGTPFAVATVISHAGSSPRKAGAKMVVCADGTCIGSIGGGRVEKETMDQAHAAIFDGTPRVLDFVLDEGHGYACGGSMKIFLDPIGRRPLLVIFGAGHVGRAITSLAHGCGFRVVVVDERADRANSAFLPGADGVICFTVEDSFGQLQLDAEAYVVIATPGHTHDFAAVRGSLRTDASFIGLVGSRRKRESLMKTLEAEGFGVEQRQRVMTPVGLEIGAQTPEEIAVSVVGELIARRRTR